MRFVVLTLAITLFPLAATADPIVIPKTRSDRPRLKSIWAEIHDATELITPDTEAVVICFLGLDCPVAQLYLPRLKELHQRFQKEKVLFYGVYPNARVDVAGMARHAHDQDIPFQVFIDTDHRLADLLDVEVTPEVVVIDSEWSKRYQGAIDNQFKRGGRRRGATVHHLLTALNSIVAGEPVAISYTPPSGCPVERLGPPAPAHEITFYRDIAPIVQNHCQTCHREGGAAPFELSTFDDAYYNAERIGDNVADLRMPPWHGFVNPKFGRLLNDKRMSKQEIATIVDWVRLGAPKGDPADAPEPVTWPEADAWEIGEPDFVYTIPGFRVPKHGILDYQFFRVPLDFKEDRWFRAVEIKAGEPEVVHHIALHIVPTGKKVFTGFSGMAELYGLNSEGGILINDYVPGDIYNAKRYSAHQAVRIPPNSDLIFELHYTPNNRDAVTDRSKVGFLWADQIPKEEILTHVFRSPIGRFRIPPQAIHHRMTDTYHFKHDVLLDAVRPHFHLRAKSFRLEIIRRDEETDEIVERETILSVPIWDQNWQRTYEFEKPLRILAGTELLATGHFDNSKWNPNNPDPSIEVQWGQQTTDEMFSTRFKYRVIKGH